MPYLGGFRGSNNNLTGPLDVLSSMAYMVSFAVDNNQLSGPVRVYLPNLKRLKYLNASNNHMSGSLLELGSPASTTPFVLALAGQDFYCPYPINLLSNSNTVLFDRSSCLIFRNAVLIVFGIASGILLAGAIIYALLLRYTLLFTTPWFLRLRAILVWGLSVSTVTFNFIFMTEMHAAVTITNWSSCNLINEPSVFYPVVIIHDLGRAFASDGYCDPDKWSSFEVWIESCFKKKNSVRIFHHLLILIRCNSSYITCCFFQVLSSNLVQHFRGLCQRFPGCSTHQDPKRLVCAFDESVWQASDVYNRNRVFLYALLISFVLNVLNELLKLVAIIVLARLGYIPKHGWGRAMADFIGTSIFIPLFRLVRCQISVFDDVLLLTPTPTDFLRRLLHQGFLSQFPHTFVCIYFWSHILQSGLDTKAWVSIFATAVQIPYLLGRSAWALNKWRRDSMWNAWRDAPEELHKDIDSERDLDVGIVHSSSASATIDSKLHYVELPSR